MSESSPTDPWTVLKLLDWTREHFEKKQVPSARLIAEMLLSHVLGCQRIELYARHDHQPDAQQLAAYRQLVRRAADHEPVAYLVGQKEFYSLSFQVTPAVLIPRPETEQLVDLALGRLSPLDRPATLWDVGTGSGCVAIAAAKNLDSLTVLATDVSDDAVAVAAANAERLGVADRVRCRVADLLQRPADCDDLTSFDAVVANLPYIANGEGVAESVKHEPGLALRGGADGLDLLRPLVAGAPDLLSIGGVLIMEFGFTQGDDVRDLIADTDRFDEPEIICDHQELERIAIATRIQ